jgi:hypothetical protein
MVMVDDKRTAGLLLDDNSVVGGGPAITIDVVSDSTAEEECGDGDEVADDAAACC